MSRLILALALALTLVGCGRHAHQDQPRLISVMGMGEASTVPDRATVTLAVEARAKALDAAQAEADGVVAKVLAVTDGLGIERDRVQTTGIQINPEFDWRPEGRRMLGYLVQRQVTVEVRDLTKLGTLMEQALATGVNNVSPPALSSSKSKELYRAALRAAAEDAMRNADELADSLGADLGPVWSASGQADGGMQPGPRPMMMAAMADGRAKVEVAESYSAGEIRYTASVQAQFEVR